MVQNKGARHHYAEPFVAIHPLDAARIGISEATLVYVSGADNQITVRALITDRQTQGSCFMPMHWTDQMSSNGRVGRILDCDEDPISGQPGLKNATVKIRPYNPRWYGFAVLAERPKNLDMDYWAIARAEQGWRVEMAGDAECSDWMQFAADLMNAPSESSNWTAYIDRAAGNHRLAYCEGGNVIGALYVSSEPVLVSRTWAASQLGEVSALGSSILAGRGGVDQPDQGPIVCACFSIGSNQISHAFKEGGCASVEDIGVSLGAGTNCGSCKTEISNLLMETR